VCRWDVQAGVQERGVRVVRSRSLRVTFSPRRIRVDGRRTRESKTVLGQAEHASQYHRCYLRFSSPSPLATGRPSSLSPAVPATLSRPRLPPSRRPTPRRPPGRFAVALREAADASGFLVASEKSQQRSLKRGTPWAQPPRQAGLAMPSIG